MRLVRQRNSALVCRLIQVLLSYFASPCVGDGDGDGDDKSCTIPRDYTQYLYSNLFFRIRSKIPLFQFFTSTLFHFPLFIFHFPFFIFHFSLFTFQRGTYTFCFELFVRTLYCKSSRRFTVFPHCELSSGYRKDLERSP
jgi:hypothetical protein